MISRILYVSDAVGAAGENLLSMADILGASDRNNRRDHVSGLLAFHNGRFLQVLEGARADLDRLMRRLQDDSRHTNIRILVDQPIAERTFSWPMARAPLTPALKALIAEAACPIEHGPSAVERLRESARALPAAA